MANDVGTVIRLSGDAIHTDRERCLVSGQDDLFVEHYEMKRIMAERITALRNIKTTITNSKLDNQFTSSLLRSLNYCPPYTSSFTLFSCTYAC